MMGNNKMMNIPNVLNVSTTFEYSLELLLFLINKNNHNSIPNMIPIDVVLETIEPKTPTMKKANIYIPRSIIGFSLEIGVAQKKAVMINIAQNFIPATSSAQPMPYSLLSCFPMNPVETMKLSTKFEKASLELIICDSKHWATATAIKKFPTNRTLTFP